jgi:branched-chain amino acid transport system permease protein
MLTFLADFLQQLVNGLASGSIYALIAVGYTMVYGVLGLINFAHGDLFMVGAFVGYYAAMLMTRADHPTWGGFLIVLVISMVVCAILGMLIDLLAYRPLRDQPRIACLITAIGVSMALEFGGQGQWGWQRNFIDASGVTQSVAFPPGPNPLAYPNIIPGINTGDQALLAFHFRQNGQIVGDVIIDKIDALIFGVTLVLMLGLRYIVQHTRTGLALRAVSQRFDTPALMGVNVNRIISFTFALGSALGAAAGVLYAVRFPKVEPLMGLYPGLKAFVAAVLGGIGSIPGAVAGGLLVGLTEVLVTYLPHGSEYKDAAAFVILIAVLLIKPTGLFGRHVSEKV